MLGQRLTEFYARKENVELYLTSAEEESFFENIDYSKLDIRDKSAVKSVIMTFFPDTIINVAAYTNVDGCETEKKLAWEINVEGVKNIALYSQGIDAHTIHISTDYVFDGKNGPYTEEDKPNPISYYGRTKLASENVLKSSGTRYTVVRTNVLFGPAKFGRPDFVKWVVNSLREGKQIRIVTDQFGNPTYLDDLVDGIVSIETLEAEGLYNIGGRDFLTRYEFTEEIADFFDLDKSLITPIKTAELNQPARRPLKSGLITDKAERELGYNPRSINKALRDMKRELGL
jgi:dTDP-4-dehydrorhamnose reductase